MEFVCNDINGPSKWFYGNGYYFRFMADGSLRYALAGDDLADPAKIEAEGKMPQTSTVKIFEHWSNHADSHA